MRILVTGGAGFVGQHVVRALSHDGHDVIVVDIEPVPAGAPGLHVRSDLRHWIPPVDSGFEAVVHLAAFGGVARAARDPRGLFEANVNATVHLVDQIRRCMKACRRVVLASSFSVYGDASPVDDRTPVGPLEPYAASKLGQELAFVGQGLPLTTLRFSSVYGRGMRHSDPEATILARMAGWIARGEPVPIFEDGNQTRDFVFVGDVVAAVRACLTEASPPLRANVCTGRPITLVRAAQVLSAAIGRPAHVKITGATRPGDMRHCYGDPKGLEALLGRPVTPFETGAREAFKELCR